MAVITGVTLGPRGFTSTRIRAGFARKSTFFRLSHREKITTGGTEGWDYITVDSDARLAYIGRENHVDVVNVDSGAVVGRVTGLEDPACSCPRIRARLRDEWRRRFGVIVDLKTWRNRCNQGRQSCSFTYDQSPKRLKRGKRQRDYDQPRMAPSLASGARRAAAVSDGKGKVYVNLTDKDQIAEVDAETMKVTHRWPLAPGTGPSGLAIDRKTRRLFSACDNQKMVIMNADTGKVVAALRTGAGTDGAGFDPETGECLASAVEQEP
jgi:hypothetical protein